MVAVDEFSTQYSANGTSWHTTYASATDNYVRYRQADGTWGVSIPLSGIRGWVQAPTFNLNEVSSTSDVITKTFPSEIQTPTQVVFVVNYFGGDGSYQKSKQAALFITGISLAPYSASDPSSPFTWTDGRTFRFLAETDNARFARFNFEESPTAGVGSTGDDNIRCWCQLRRGSNSGLLKVDFTNHSTTGQNETIEIYAR